MRFLHFFKPTTLVYVVVLLAYSGAAAQPLQRIRIGYPSISSRQAQLWVAKEEAFSANTGLTSN